jgi:hypothetical membrane protein
MEPNGRDGRLAGVLAPLALLTTAIGGALATPGYRWPTDPFSEVGGTDGVVAFAFDAGLFLSGALALVLAVALRRRWRPALGALYGVGGVGAGLFPVGSGLHGIATPYFFTAWLPPVVAGVADWRAGRRTYGVVGVALGVFAVGIWLPYNQGLSWATVGYGATELVTFLAWGTWSVWAARRLGNQRAVGDATERGVPT